MPAYFVEAYTQAGMCGMGPAGLGECWLIILLKQRVWGWLVRLNILIHTDDVLLVLVGEFVVVVNY